MITGSSWSNIYHGCCRLRRVFVAGLWKVLGAGDFSPDAATLPCSFRWDGEKENARHSMSGWFPSMSMFKQYQNAAMAVPGSCSLFEMHRDLSNGCMTVGIATNKCALLLLVLLDSKIDSGQ